MAGDTDGPWREVDERLTELLASDEPLLEETLRRNAEAGLPAIDVSPPQGKLLEILVRTTAARRVLELGTLGGYSTLWLARGLPDGGRIVTLELDARHAETARGNLERAGISDRVELRVGPALESLRALREEGSGPFDFIFIDADKRSTPAYFEAALELARAGTLIVTDNVVRGGALFAESPDENAAAMRRFVEQLAAERRVVGTVIQTVGLKGYDGFAIALVTSG